ncbi:hypothetical protein LCM4573_03140 [Rhizobium sp. LCM 4573]|nr:hypothetical protein LCM4573_03140 [Rhizobium sp. LCM 4573]
MTCDTRCRSASGCRVVLKREPASLPNGDLNRGWRQGRIELTFRQKRRLSEEAGLLSSVRLRGMHKEWMAQIDGSRRARCKFDLAIFRGGITVGGELSECRALFAIGQQLAGDDGMGFLILVGASSRPVSENRNSISNARPLLLTLARHSMKSEESPKRVLSRGTYSRDHVPPSDRRLAPVVLRRDLRERRFHNYDRKRLPGDACAF